MVTRALVCVCVRATQTDNISGVAGIGQMTAVALLDHFPGGIDDIYSNLDEVSAWIDFQYILWAERGRVGTRS